MADSPEPGSGPDTSGGGGDKPTPPPSSPPPSSTPSSPPPPPPPPVLETFYSPIYVVSAVFGAIFIIGPCLVRSCANKGIIRCCIMMTAFCMWLFWVIVYVSQMNPLIGPKLHNHTVAWVAYKWGDQLFVPPGDSIPQQNDTKNETLTNDPPPTPDF